MQLPSNGVYNCLIPMIRSFSRQRSYKGSQGCLKIKGFLIYNPLTMLLNRDEPLAEKCPNHELIGVA